MLNSLARHRRGPKAGPTTDTTGLTRGRLYWLCVVQSVCGLSGSPPVAFARTDNSGRPIPRRHPLTLIVSDAARALARSSFVGTGLCVLARTI